MVLLTIDSQEAPYRQKMLQDIAKRLEMETEVRPASADAAIGSALGLEFKKPNDFISSIQDGRLFRQAQDLTAYDRQAILVEGNLGDVMYCRGGMSVPSVLGAIYAVSIRQGVPVIFTHAIRTGLFGVHMDMALRQGITEGIPNAAFARKKSTPKDMALGVLSAFPGVGLEKATAILTEFGTLGNALANVSSWDQAEGIGPKTVASCLSLLSQTQMVTA